MEDDKGAGCAARAANSCDGGASSSFDSKEMPQRQRFSVDLRPGETTIVSWKRLIKDSNKAIRTSNTCELPSGAHPALESRIAPAGNAGECELKDALPPPNRFNAVIEKIERLYKGKHSSDEEDLDNVPDDDQYDTDDSFIDDTELDEYFQVDKSATKHNGFFVNRGRLERLNEPTSSPIYAPKKRRRKDLAKAPGEKEVEHMPKKLVKMGGVRMKAAARNAPLVGSKLLSPSRTSAPLQCDDHYQEGKLGASTVAPKQKDADSTIKVVPALPEKMSSKDPSSFPVEAKDVEKQKSEAILSKELTNKVKVTGEHSDAMHETFRNKGIPVQSEPHTRKSLSETSEMFLSTKGWHKEKSGRSSGLPDMNSSGSKHPGQKVKSPSMMGKEGACVRPKGTMLERAIRELEKRVAESRPPTVEVQEADASSQGVKRRLPQDVKQKLAKVARLAQSSQGKISEELINRLMTILGHLVQLKTLKRNLKEMVELGLSAKQKKDDRFQQIKREVTEMIRAQIASLKSKAAEQHDAISGDFQETPSPEEKGALYGRYKMDDAMEDRICDLYDLYVEGMDEDKGPQIRKLYVELAELWPNGSMDNHGIKNAVCRAKERRRGLSGLCKDAEKLKRKKMSPVIKKEESSKVGASGGSETSSNAKARALQERPITEITPGLFHVPGRGPTMKLSPSPWLEPSFYTINETGLHLPKLEKIKSSSESSNLNKRDKIDGFMKKKVKRKRDPDTGDTVSVYPMKVSSLQQGKEIHKTNKKLVNSSMIQQHKSSLPPSVGHPSFEQPT